MLGWPVIKRCGQRIGFAVRIIVFSTATAMATYLGGATDYGHATWGQSGVTLMRFRSGEAGTGERARRTLVHEQKPENRSSYVSPTCNVTRRSMRQRFSRCKRDLSWAPLTGAPRQEALNALLPLCAQSGQREFAPSARAATSSLAMA